MHKEQRQARLLGLIEENRIRRQEELAELLAGEGFQVTQSSVSRDLIELGIIKIDGLYAAPNKAAGFPLGLLSLETAGDNLIVAKCAPGMASAVCVRIDDARIPEIVGTIAGEDTIFIAVRSAHDQKVTIGKVWGVLKS